MSAELPHGWIDVELPVIAELNMGQSPPSNTYNTEGKGLPFFQGKTEFGDIYPTVVKFCSSPSKVAERDDILISVRAPVGPTNLCQQKSCIGRGLAAIRPRGEIPNRYLLYYLRSVEGWLSQQGTGSTFTAISKTDLEQLRVSVAPLAEQRRIVAKLEKLLGKVNACQQRLAKIPILLKRCRQSILAAACSGRLTADWRTENSDAEPYTGDAEPAANGDDDFPASWRVTRLGTLTTLVTSGSRGWAKYYSDSGSIFIRAQNINSDFLDLEDIAFVRPPASAEGLRTGVRQHDLLVTITGANVTKSALVEKPIDDAYVSQHVALVRLSDVRLSIFIFYSILSVAHGRKQLQAAAYGQGKPGLNLDNIRDVVVGLPPLAEQQEIVRQVKALFALADKIEARLTKAQAHVDKLTPSLLAQAFRGELVPTEAELARREGHDYEPASALLERIHSEASLVSG
jgi:type I restriction enzyme, S subunit